MSESSRRFVTTTVEVEGRVETRVVEMPAVTLEPWGADAALTHVGARARRVDGLLKTAGRAPYTTDLSRPGMAHAVFVRADVPRGRVVRLDTDAARAMPGVLDIIGQADVPARTRLFSADVTYVGMPIAAVCAASLAQAEAAARAVRVTIEIGRAHV